MQCTRQLLNGKQCEKTAYADGMCEIHFGLNNGTLPTMLQLYLAAGKEPDLSYLKFENVSFGNITFDNKPNFEGSRFDNCSFVGACFVDASFNKCTFIDTIFTSATFRGKKTSFALSSFIGNTDNRLLENCVFENLDRLDAYNIHWRAKQKPFASCYIDSRFVDFSDSTIEWCDFTLILIHFNHPAQVFNPDCIYLNDTHVLEMRHITLPGRFDLAMRGHKPIPPPVMHFEETDFDNMKAARFYKANLTQSYWTGCQIERITFIEPAWGKKNGRSCLHRDPEKNLASPFEMERLYIQLKKNFEEKRDYRSASDWHYREMESRREQVGLDKNIILRELRKNLFSFIALYKLFSQYGESYIRPLAWLSVIILLGPWVYLITGVKESDILVDNYVSGLIYSLSTTLFIKSEMFEAASRITELVMIVQKLSLMLFGSLFLLALRRRFRR